MQLQEAAAESLKAQQLYTLSTHSLIGDLAAEGEAAEAAMEASEHPPVVPVSKPKVAMAQKKVEKKKPEAPKPQKEDDIFDDSDVQISFIPRIDFQEVKSEPEEGVDAGNEVSSTFLSKIISNGGDAEQKMFMQTIEGQQQLAQAKKDQEELIDSQDVQLRFVEGGDKAFAKTFASEDTDDKEYVKSAIKEGEDSEQALYQQTADFKFNQQQAAVEKTRQLMEIEEDGIWIRGIILK